MRLVFAAALLITAFSLPAFAEDHKVAEPAKVESKGGAAESVKEPDMKAAINGCYAQIGKNDDGKPDHEAMAVCVKSLTKQK